MKIYQTASTPNARRVRIFLAEKGIDDIDYVELDIQKGDNLSAEFRQKNPLGKIPVLELDDGQCISESIAICRYFEMLQPEPNLFGSTPLEVAQIEQWQRWAEFFLMIPTGMCFQHTTGYFKDRMTPIAEWGEECGKNVAKFMHFLNKHLASSTYLAGEVFSIADIIALVAIDFSRVNKIRIQADQKDLLRWHNAVSSRPSAKA